MVKRATEEQIEQIINQYPGTKSVICYGDNTFTLVYTDNKNVIAFLSAFFKKIPAPLNDETECFINVIDIFDFNYRNKGIGSLLVQEAIKIAKEEKAIQVRAYCDINNKPSHMLWLKNNFGISPVKMPDGSIAGSFITYRI